MAQVLLFHHAHGLTAGVLSFADQLRSAGHIVLTPDLYAGRVFADLDEGVAFAEEVGFENIAASGASYSDELTGPVVYAGFSLGVLPAQNLAQTSGSAAGALLYHEALPARTFGGPWPRALPAQIHVSEQDPWVELTREEMAAEIPGAEIFTYPGSRHLFADSTLPEYEPESAGLLLERTIRLLGQIDEEAER